MRSGLFLFLFLFTIKCLAQQKPIEGIVFDKENKERIATVNVHDITSGIAVYDNLKGVFSIKANEGDQLVFTRQDYKPDTVKIQNHEALAVYMIRAAIQLKLVTVHDSTLTPEMRLAATKADYSKIYGSLAYNDALSVAPGIGVGLSIDALWNSLSRSGRNASRLREIIEQDYEQNAIDYRFSRNFVQRITGLKDEKLSSFMIRYRPGFYTTQTMTDYEFITMIRSNLRRFLRNQRSYSLPSLQTFQSK
jgi:hypothetical protein